MFGMSMCVTIMWLLVFPGCTIAAGVFFKTNAWKKIINYYSGWLESENGNNE